MMSSYPRFKDAISHIRTQLRDEGELVHSRRWQGVEIANNPNMACLELTHVHLEVDMNGYEHDLEAYAKCIEPDLPWADAHFEERVSGVPMNPGTEFKNWPWNKGRGAESFLDRRGKFNHNYMERYWPKNAAVVQEPTASKDDYRRRFRDYFQTGNAKPMRGIMYEYGDLGDVIDLLMDDPLTRQAYLPVWFPEDTGGGDKRAPCTIGYHFLMRGDRLSVNYHIRSCDFVKHFRNDLYLTARLVVWVLRQLQSRDARWKDVELGKFVMQIGSLHSFKPDWELI
jgi:hypothetical protein